MIVPTNRRRRKIIGKAQFEQCVLFSRKQLLDFTVYPCYDVINNDVAYPNLTLLAESQIFRVNTVWHSNKAIPPELPSPTELVIVASANSTISYTQVLPTELLASTKKLRCMELIPWINSAVGIQTLHISLLANPEYFLYSIFFSGIAHNCRSCSWRS